ncbi:FG-GAP repeat domain-containing protein [Haloarcula laminariae]|uniref:FG-GAP repeat domain-containing protein n=1 Tax=Haloarcula laminariae TaxID=2961577 RepID=UPI002406DF4A|nr:VCBS repeat-containing protein [Halomicroarcula sp. FL173]
MGPQLSTASSERAISPVVGTVLFLAVVLLLVAISGALFLGLTEEQDPAPQARLALEPIESSDDYRLVHESGDSITGSRVRIRGIEDPDTLAGTELTAGSEIRVTPTSETVRIVWEEQRQQPSSYILSTFDTTLSSSSSSASLPDGVVFTGATSGILNVSGDGGSKSVIPTPSAPQALGPASDVDGDGTIEVPYANSAGEIRLVDAAGNTETVASTIPSGSGIDTNKTRLTTGSWDGCSGVLFAGDDSRFYCSSVGNATAEIADPGDGSDAVAGVRDIDGDGDDEFVFVDGSQTLQYYDTPGGTPTVLSTTTLGSNTGVGGGSFGDFDDDGQLRVAYVDGSTNIHLVDAGSDTKIQGTDIDSGTTPTAAKSPVTAADVDGDGLDELVYVDASTGDLRYIDKLDRPPGNWELQFLTADGSRVGGDVATGTV